MITQPMLAATCKDIDSLQYPVLVTPKLDGVRCLKINGQVLSRKFRPINNHSIRQYIESTCPADNLDGELLIPGESFGKISGAVNSFDTTPEFVYCVFDIVVYDISHSYYRRMLHLESFLLPERFIKILPTQCNNAKELLDYEEKMLYRGYEGVMIRSPHGPYKCGRSTLKEGYLLKLKRFADGEAVIEGTYEKLTNTNKLQTSALGYAKRSSAQSGMLGVGEIGGYFVCDCVTGVRFYIGHNVTMVNQSPTILWNNRDYLVGKKIKYKYQKIGVKDKPRFPQFLGFRFEWDI